MDPDIRQLSDRLRALETKIDLLDRRLDEFHKEIGANSGRELYRQINDLEGKFEQVREQVFKISSDTGDIRQQVTFDKANFDEIKKALALIYRNTDELEKYLMGEDRESY